MEALLEFFAHIFSPFMCLQPPFTSSILKMKKEVGHKVKSEFGESASYLHFSDGPPQQKLKGTGVFSRESWRKWLEWKGGPSVCLRPISFYYILKYFIKSFNILLEEFLHKSSRN